MGQGSIITPVDTPAVTVLFTGTLLAALAQLAAIYIIANSEGQWPSKARMFANLGSGALAGFVMGTLFLNWQTSPVTAQMVLTVQALAGLLGYDLLRATAYKLLGKGGER